MKTPIILLILFVLIIVILLFFIGKHSQNKQAPGLVDGFLSRCSTKPNCVCSEHPDDVDHYIDPIKLPRKIEVFNMQIIEEVIKGMGGIVQYAEDNYIAATFSSSIFGFVDDLEIRIDPTQGIIHFRSASRVGYDDAGVNRRRVDLLKGKYINKLKEANKSL